MSLVSFESIDVAKPLNAAESRKHEIVVDPEIIIMSKTKYSGLGRINPNWPSASDLNVSDSSAWSNPLVMSNRSQNEQKMRESAGSIQSSTVLKQVDQHQVPTSRDSNSLFDHVRTLVSKKKRRYTGEGINLDLTYIFGNLIAMGFPSEGVEGLYRNRMKDIQKFFNSKHKNKYTIYNLCSKRHYCKNKFEGRVVHFPFDDHNCPAFDDLWPLCNHIDNWLSQDQENVAAIHCKAGKGRTGLVICTYLLHTGTWEDANSALDFYAFSRTKNMKGVTIPSQRRWVRYYETMLKRKATGQIRVSKRYRMKSVFVSGSAPSFTEMVVFNEKTRSYHPNENFGMVTSLNTMAYNHPQFKEGILLKCRPDLVIHKDVKVEWNLEGRIKKGKTRAFSLWFNTDFIEDDNRLWFVREDIDKVNKLKKLSDFIVCIEFEPLDEHKVAKRKENFLDLCAFKSPDELALLACTLQKEIKKQNRVWKGDMCMNWFRGLDAVVWLIEEGGAKNVEDAVEIGDRLRYHGLIKVFSKEDEKVEGRFENTTQLWQFSHESREVNLAIEEEIKENVGAVRATDDNDLMEGLSKKYSGPRGVEL